MNDNVKASITFDDAVKAILNGYESVEEFKQHMVKLYMSYAMLTTFAELHDMNPSDHEETINNLFLLKILCGM